MFIDRFRRVLAFDVFDLGTAISNLASVESATGAYLSNISK
jgi:hypothetical protein